MFPQSKLFIQPPKKRSIFSHTPGICLALFGTSYNLRCYPTRCYVETDPLLGPKQIIDEFILPFHGPISSWKVQRHTHKALIEVEGVSSSNVFFRYHIHDLPGSVTFNAVKGFIQNKSVPSDIAHNNIISSSFLELGGYRSLEWEKISSSCHTSYDMRELFQVIIATIPPKKPKEGSQFYSQKSILTTIVKMIQEQKQHSYDTIFSLFKALFQTSFRGVFTLSPEDDLYHGYEDIAFPIGYSTFEILQVYSYAIHAMIALSLSKDALLFSPLIRKLFPSGRVWNLILEDVESMVSYEWRKEKPRRICYGAYADQNLFIDFGINVKEYSLRINKHSSKKKQQKGSDSLCLKAGIEYLYDSFLF